MTCSTVLVGVLCTFRDVGCGIVVLSDASDSSVLPDSSALDTCSVLPSTKSVVKMKAVSETPVVDERSRTALLLSRAVPVKIVDCSLETPLLIMLSDVVMSCVSTVDTVTPWLDDKYPVVVISNLASMVVLADGSTVLAAGNVLNIGAGV